MAVLVIGEVEGVTPEMHDEMVANLGQLLREAKGFIGHLAGPYSDRWRVMELWETKADATRWFAEFVSPNLPEGVKPKRTFHELHTLLLK